MGGLKELRVESGELRTMDVSACAETISYCSLEQ